MDKWYCLNIVFLFDCLFFGLAKPQDSHMDIQQFVGISAGKKKQQPRNYYELVCTLKTATKQNFIKLCKILDMLLLKMYSKSWNVCTLWKVTQLVILVYCFQNHIYWIIFSFVFIDKGAYKLCFYSNFAF